MLGAERRALAAGAVKCQLQQVAKRDAGQQRLAPNLRAGSSRPPPRPPGGWLLWAPPKEPREAHSSQPQI